MPTVVDPIETAREQLHICREEIMLGARRVRAQAAPSLEEVRDMATAILEYFGAQLALEGAETDTEQMRDNERAELLLAAKSLRRVARPLEGADEFGLGGDLPLFLQAVEEHLTACGRGETAAHTDHLHGRSPDVAICGRACGT